MKINLSMKTVMTACLPQNLQILSSFKVNQTICGRLTAKKISAFSRPRL